MKDTGRTEEIKSFFNGDSVRYLDERYPAEPRTCDQFSYHIRKQYVLEMLGRTGPAGRLLDIGCGPAVLTRDLVEHGWQVNGIDLSSGMLEAANRITAGLPQGSARFAAGVGTHLPFKDQTFDTVLCIGVVSYIEDVSLLMREVRRVLRPGGEAIFQISNAASIASLDAWAWGWLRRLMAPLRPLDTHDKFRAAVRLFWHAPGRFDAWARRAGLARREFRFYDFRPPLVLNRLSHSGSLAVGKLLERIGGSRLATPLAAGYLVRFKRDGIGRS
jgi:SAM-dependent methyltransferase